ncbi:MAG: NYN domain-containing protein [Candidatus Dormiibacterota bacterium]
MSSRPRAQVYVDGFNLYRGRLKDVPSIRWLDLRALAAKLAAHQNVRAVKYFTAKVRSQESARRQNLYLRALRATAVEVHDDGTFLSHPVIRPLADTARHPMMAVLEKIDWTTETWHPLAHPCPGETARASVIDTEEKGSDVNLASYLLRDVFAGEIDAAIVISGDSDLRTPVAMAVEHGVPVHVLNPTSNRVSQELQTAASMYDELPLAYLMTCQLPNPVTDPKGQKVWRPNRWS